MDKKKFENECYISEERDYLNYVTKTSTEEQRDQFYIGDVFINGVVCIHCREFLRSKNKHDFKKCSCGLVGVDGGSHYQRLLGDPEDYIQVYEKFYDKEKQNNIE